MDVRIQNGALGGMAGTDAKRTEGAPSTNPPLAEIGQRLQAQSDRIEVSAISEAIVAAGNAIEALRAGRVKALSGLVGSGNYHVPSEKLADAMVSTALDVKAAK